MENSILRRIATPLAERLGTSLAVYLIATVGGDASLAKELATAFVAVSLVGVDVIVSKLMRSKS